MSSFLPLHSNSSFSTSLQNSLLHSEILSFRSRSSAPPSRIAAASVFSSPSSHGRLEAQPYFTSSTSFDPFSLVSSAPQTPATAMSGAESDVMGLLLRERIIFLGSSIDDFVADAIISQLLLLDAQDHTNSPRASAYSSTLLAVVKPLPLENVRADVSTIALGFVGSTASIILGGGGKRLSMPNTRIVIQQPIGGVSGQAIDVENQAKEIMHNKKIITGHIDSIIPLEPVPEKVKPKLNYEELYKDPRKFLTPEIPDDEIY